MLTKIVLSTAIILPLQAFAAGDSAPLPQQEWTFMSPTHSWDKAQIMKGYQVATDVCLSCHSFKYIKHRHLQDVGFSEYEVKELAKRLDLTVDDALISPLSDADAAEIYGKPVPDLSVMTRARVDGFNYVYALMTGYEDAPEGFDGVNYNTYFPGHSIAMPAPLSDGQVEFFDGSDNTVEDMSKAVTYFMAWTAEPERTQRQKLGIYVIFYLIILTTLLYLTKKHIWKDVK